jgi:hypothetical protein
MVAVKITLGKLYRERSVAFARDYGSRPVLDAGVDDQVLSAIGVRSCRLSDAVAVSQMTSRRNTGLSACARLSCPDESALLPLRCVDGSFPSLDRLNMQMRCSVFMQMSPRQQKTFTAEVALRSGLSSRRQEKVWLD